MFDITRFVRPGRRYVVSVDVKGRQAEGLRTDDGYYLVPDAADWSPNVAQGIFRSATLRVYPAVFISDALVRPSVAHRTLRYDAWVTNSTGHPRTVRLAAVLSSSNGANWPYPALPSRTVRVPARKSVEVTVGPVAWRLGPGSYWWPNVPYRPGYRAQLHQLTLTLWPAARRGAASLAEADYRFGFWEMRQVRNRFELNGMWTNLRGDNLQGANYDSIDYGGGRGDAYDTFPGFLPPSNTNPGWPRAVENYEQLNYNFVRIHQEPASPYMLDVADERGLMMMDETGIRSSNQRQDFARGHDNMISGARDLVLRDRNHPSVVRWSEANEPTAGRGYTTQFLVDLYRTITALDDTRPISDDGGDDLPYANFSTNCHYRGGSGRYTEEVCPRAIKPFGQGEFIWPADDTKQGFMWFATATEKMREHGARDTRPYALVDAWSSVVPGTRAADMTIELTEFRPAPVHPLYGEDNLPDPTSNPIIERVTKAFSPVLVADRDYWEAQKYSNQSGEWPSMHVTLTRGSPTTRTLEIFNDTFAGQRIQVGWELHQNVPGGPLAAVGNLAVDVPLGAHRERTITFIPPAPASQLYLVLSAKPGQGELFRDDAEAFQ